MYEVTTVAHREEGIRDDGRLSMVLPVWPVRSCRRESPARRRAVGATSPHCRASAATAQVAGAERNLLALAR